MATNKKYSKAFLEFICDHVADGMTVKAICEKYPRDLCPEERTVYRWKKKYPEFNKALEEAYQTFFYKKLDEIEELSKELLDNEKSIKELEAIDASADSKKEANDAKKNWLYARKARQDAIRMRLDVLKFTISKIAPKMVPELKDTPASQAIAYTPPQITIINFQEPKKELLEVKAVDQILIEQKGK